MTLQTLILGAIGIFAVVFLILTVIELFRDQPTDDFPFTDEYE